MAEARRPTPAPSSAVAQPFGAKRVGGGVETYPMPDKRQARSPLQLRVDPRSRFKDSYGPKPPGGRTSPGRGRPGAVRDDGADPVGQDAQNRLQLQLHEAQAEIQQLRNALRASAGALQHASNLLPPGHRQSTEAQDDLVGDLIMQLKERDERILNLKRQNLDYERRHENSHRSVMMALQRWAPREDVQILREVWDGWRQSCQELRTDKRCQKAAEEAIARMEPKIMKVIGGLASFGNGSEVRAMLSGWRSVVRGSKWAAEKDAHRNEKVRMTLFRWQGDQKHSVLAVCFGAWRCRMLAGRQEKREKELQAEHIRVSKQMHKQSIAKTALALVGQRQGELDPKALKVMLQSWRECMLEGRAQKALEFERQCAKESERHVKEQAQRRSIFLMVQGDHERLAACFKTWEEFLRVQHEKEAMARQRFLRALVAYWRRLAASNHSSREVEKLRADFEAERLKHQSELKKHQQLRHAISELSFDNPLHHQKLVFSAWLEFLNEERRERKHQEERKQWQEEFDKRQKELIDQQRNRGLMMALKQSSEGLLRAVWSAWAEARLEARREQMLEGEQRVFEADLRKAKEEAERLAAKLAEQAERAQLDQRSLQERMEAEAQQLAHEARIADSRHHDLHQRRKAMFMWSVGDRDRTMIVQMAWSAWRECMQDAKALEVEELRRKLADLRAAKGQQGPLLFETAARAEYMEVAEKTLQAEEARQPLMPESPSSSTVAKQKKCGPRCRRHLAYWLRNCCRCLLPGSKRVDSPPPKPRTGWDGAKTLKKPLKLSAEVRPQGPEPANAAPAAVEGAGWAPRRLCCPNGHELVRSELTTGWICDACEKPVHSSAVQRLRCDACRFDLCPPCAAREVSNLGPAAASGPGRPHAAASEPRDPGAGTDDLPGSALDAAPSAGHVGLADAVAARRGSEGSGGFYSEGAFADS